MWMTVNGYVMDEYVGLAGRGRAGLRRTVVKLDRARIKSLADFCFAGQAKDGSLESSALQN